jgi:hypothetical protein
MHCSGDTLHLPTEIEVGDKEAIEDAKVGQGCGCKVMGDKDIFKN